MQQLRNVNWRGAESGGGFVLEVGFTLQREELV
jgi:hypothetical protein